MSTKPPRKKMLGSEPGRGDEARFLARYDPSKFERPSVTVDVVLLTVQGGRLSTLLIKRDQHPFRGRWSLPGGFVRLDESLDAAAARVLAEKAGLGRVWLEQLYTFGALDRDPRTRVISIAYYALVSDERLAAKKPAMGRTMAEIVVPWEGETGGAVELRAAGGESLSLAFDHAQIVGAAIKRLRGKLDYAPIGFQLLPERFTLFELQRVHETVLGRTVNKDSFRRRMLASGLLEASGEMQEDVGHRPAELYQFRQRSAV
jgi:8-oxo-dGTP diphosphatase